MAKKTTSSTTTKAPAKKVKAKPKAAAGVDRQARAALVALAELVDGLPPTMMIGDMPERAAKFKAAAAELKPLGSS